MSKTERKKTFKEAWEQWDNKQQEAIQDQWNKMQGDFAQKLTNDLMRALQLSGKTIPKDMVRAFVKKKIFS